jgi:hypothetical protein
VFVAESDTLQADSLAGLMCSSDAGSKQIFAPLNIPSHGVHFHLFSALFYTTGFKFY